MRNAQPARRRRLNVDLLEPRHCLAGLPLITEFMADNARSLQDSDGRSSDWIELLNAGDDAVNLEHWSLTDDADEPNKWRFPPIDLAPGEYLIVFASGQTYPQGYDAGGRLHATFRLSADGEYLALTDPSGTVRQEFGPTYPAQAEDVAFGLPYTAGPAPFGQPGYLHVPTPGQPNGATFARLTLDTVEMSQPDQTFVGQLRVTLATTASEGQVFYTLDGSEPTEASRRYDGPFDLQETAQLRARVIQPDAVPGPITTRTYLKLAASLANRAAELPIAVIDNLGRGAIPNAGWNQTNAGIRQVARQTASLMIFEPQQSLSTLAAQPQLTSRVGIRVRGAYSSSFARPGYSLELWDEHDNDQRLSLLGMEPAADWVMYAPNSSFDEALIDNTFMFEVQRQMGHWAPDFHYVELYLNRNGNEVTASDYAGLYAFFERPERGAGRLDFPAFAADGSSGGWLLEINRMDSISEDGQLPKNFHTAGPNGIQETPRDLHNSSSVGDDIPRQYNAYINFEHPNPRDITEPQRVSIENWFRQMEDVLYDRVPDVPWNDPVNGYAKYIDVDSFIDYLILNNLSHNGDGLLLSMWLYNPDPQGDGKLTFGPIWDVDLGSFSGSPGAELMRNTDQLWYARLFRDPDFAQRYVDRWTELRETVLRNENLASIIDRLHQTIGELAVERNGLRNWPTRLATMKNWVTQRADAIDQSSPPLPVFEPGSGPVMAGTELRISAGTNVVYYTLDGSDPRLPGGGISPAAQTANVAQPLIVQQDLQLTARTYRNRRWSAPQSLTLTVLPLPLTNDVNQDGLVNGADVDRMCQAIRSADAALDRNGDGTADSLDLQLLLSSAWNSSLGDANLDGQFNSQDLIAVLAAGRYQTDQAATWATGDWTCDERFGTDDLVAALTANVYSPAAVAAARAGSRATASSGLRADLESAAPIAVLPERRSAAQAHQAALALSGRRSTKQPASRATLGQMDFDEVAVPPGKLAEGMVRLDHAGARRLRNETHSGSHAAHR